ncbi:MAG TPA: MgtC/SapB family protein, partial [Polyangia bacterium]|nr:MgtC/SapB family protein [Polyangia bacterium]
MRQDLLNLVPPDALKIGLVLAISFFVGLEREEHKQREPGYAFGGVRSFPLIGLTSYALALLSTPQLVPWTAGLAVIGGLMALSFFHKLGGESSPGMTTEISALAVYVIGGLIQREYYWIATAVGVLGVLLLELKRGLEGLTRYVASGEIVTVAKFLMLAAVILPVLPDRELTRFHINPFKTWLVVVAVSGVSFASYVLQRVFKQRGGVILSAVLGGAYSSTVTTVALARQSKNDARPNLIAGGMLIASATMYLRLVLLLSFFNVELAAMLVPAFGSLALIGGLTGWLFARRQGGSVGRPAKHRDSRNPLELGAAFLFATIFVVVMVVTDLARRYLGRAGLYGLAGVMGITDVDPFILGLTQTSPAQLRPATAAAAIAIAAA